MIKSQNERTQIGKQGPRIEVRLRNQSFFLPLRCVLTSLIKIESQSLICKKRALN